MRYLLLLPMFFDNILSQTHIVALGLKRSLQLRTIVFSAFHTFLVFVTMASVDDIVPNTSVAQEEIDYEAAIAAAEQQGSNPQQAEFPAAATPPAYESRVYPPASQDYAALSQFEDPTQYFPGQAQQTVASSVQSPAQPRTRTPAPGELGITQQQVDSAPPLELGLENLLRQCDVKENVIQAFRVRGITDRLLFINLDDTIESLRDTCKEALGIDVSINFE